MEKLSRNDRERTFRESLMVEAAEKLFIERGFDDVSMDEISRAAQFTKRTLYQYFTSKEDLFFAVTLKGFKLMAHYCSNGFGYGKTGFDKLLNGVKEYHRFSKEHTGLFHLMNRVGHMRRKAPQSPKLDEWRDFNGMLFKGVANVITEGINDGSIRDDIEPMKGAFSMIFLATGFIRLLNETGENFADHFNLDIDEFTQYSLSLLYDAIRPENAKKIGKK